MKRVSTDRVDVQALIREYEAEETPPARKRELRVSIIVHLAGPFVDFCHKHGVKAGQCLHVTGVGTLTWKPVSKRQNRQMASRATI